MRDPAVHLAVLERVVDAGSRARPGRGRGDRLAPPRTAGQSRVPARPASRTGCTGRAGLTAHAARRRRGRRPVGHAARDHPRMTRIAPPRLRLQPDERRRRRTCASGPWLVPDPRGRRLGRAGRRAGQALRRSAARDECPDRPRRRRHVPARRPGRGRRGRADPRGQPGQGRLPVQGRGGRVRAGPRGGRRTAAFSIDERMTLRGLILPAGGRKGSREVFALNDIVVARGSLARVVRLDVAIGPSHLATFIADGLIVASPTGSTGYSFSAGGPILDPVSRNLVVTPIAGYLSAIRSVVVSPLQTVRGPGGRRLRGARSASTAARTSRSTSAMSSRSRPGSGRSGSSNRRARCPSGTCSATRSSCCRADDRRTDVRPGLLELTVADLALIDRLDLALRARPERDHRRDRGRQEPADRRARPGARRARRQQPRSPRGASARVTARIERAGGADLVASARSTRTVARAPGSTTRR